MSTLKLLTVTEDRNVTPSKKHLQAAAIVPKLETVLSRSCFGAKLKRLLRKHPKIRTLWLDINSARPIAPVRDGNRVYHKMI